MPSPSTFRVAALCAALLACLGGTAQAQKVAPKPQIGAPSASSLATFAAPKTSGLNPPVPAGLSAGSGARASSVPAIAAGAVTAPSIASNTTVNPADGSSTTTTTDATATSTTTTSMFNSVVTDSSVSSTDTGEVLGAATVAANVARGPAQTVGLGGSGLNPVDVARSFLRADSNGNGELSRAEAQRLSMAPLTFEEMDRNFDGVVTRAEYEDAMR